MTQYAQQFGVNELGEIVTSTGVGTRNVVAFLPVDYVSVDSNNRLVLAGDAQSEFDIRKFGYVTGQTSDAAPAINAAVEAIVASASNRGTVVLPSGNIYIYSPIYLRDRVSIRGEGSSNTHLIVKADVDAIRIWADYHGGSIGRTAVMDLGIRWEDADYATFTNGKGIHILSATVGNVWKPFIHNVSLYQVPNDGIAILGTADSYCAEHTLYNVEIGKAKGHGLNQNYYVYDAHCVQVYVDGGSGTSSGYGFYTQGGSGTYLHCHAVACGTNNGAGTFTGGGFRLDDNYSSWYNCHADRCGGNGWVVGGYSGAPARREHAFYQCLSFNSGVYYTNPNQSVTRTGANWKFGAVEGLKLDSCKAGKLGSTYAYANGRGIQFDSSDITQVTLRDCKINDNDVGIYINAGIDMNKVFMDNTDLLDNTTDITGTYNTSWIKETV